MKILLCAFLVAISSQVILCDDVNMVRLINRAVPDILQAGINEGKLPGGPYYVHHVIKSSIGAQDSHFTLDIRQLDNQTIVTLKATVDNNDWSVKTSCFTSKIGENVRAWTQGWEFTWLSYAPQGRSDNYCVYKIIEWLEFVPWNFYTLSAEQLALDSEIRVGYELLEEAKKGQFNSLGTEEINIDMLIFLKFQFLNTFFF